jgi:opacity protein-like surface antigen
MKVKKKYLLAFTVFLLIISTYSYSQETNSQINASDFGASSSLSLGIAGHDVVSAMFRLYLNDKNSLMTGIGYKVFYFDVDVDRRISYSVSAGLTHSLRKNSRITRKNRLLVIHSGLYCIGGYTFGTSLEPFGQLSESYLSFGYNNEYFFKQKTNRSISIMMGPGLSLLHSKADYKFNLFGEKTRLLTSLYCMIQYNLYFNNKK